jgi:hypothetical protein
MKKDLRHHFLMLVFMLCAWQGTFARQADKAITLKGNTVTLQDFIQQVKAQQALQFTFDDGVNALLQRNVNIRKNKTSLKEALGWLNADLAIGYKIVDNYIILNTTAANKSKISGGDGRIRGKILDESQETLIGATIKIVEAGKSTIAAIDGSYSVTVPPGTYTMEVSFISYQTEVIKNITVQPDQSVVTNVVLKGNQNSLNEVVVTALGIKKRERALGYASAQLSASDINSVPQPNVLNSLSAKVPGVEVRSTGSDPGSSVCY